MSSDPTDPHHEGAPRVCRGHRRLCVILDFRFRVVEGSKNLGKHGRGSGGPQSIGASLWWGLLESQP